MDRPVAFEHLEKALRPLLLVPRGDAVGVEFRFSVREEATQLVRAQPRRAPHEHAFRVVEHRGIHAPGEAVEQTDDRVRRGDAERRRGDRGGDVRVLRRERLAGERGAGRCRLTDLDELDRLADARPRRRLDQRDRRTEALLLRERVATELRARLPRDLRGDGHERGIHLALQRPEGGIDLQQFAGGQRLGRSPATGGVERGEGLRDAGERVDVHTSL